MRHILLLGLTHRWGVLVHDRKDYRVTLTIVCALLFVRILLQFSLVYRHGIRGVCSLRWVAPFLARFCYTMVVAIIRMIHVIVDVFRAFSTAAQILQAQPKAYILTNHCIHIRRLLSSPPSEAILVGKPEANSTLRYTIPNSPTLASQVAFENRTIYHRTTAGATGVLTSEDADIVLCVGFNNLQATVNYIKSIKNHKLVIKPMGHEANVPTLEDDLCVFYLQRLLTYPRVDVHLPIQQLKACTGKYFFQHHPEYPERDFATCLHIDSHNFAIRANVKGVYAHLYPVYL